MNTINLVNELKKYKKGWVVINSKNKVIDWASSFAKISKKVEKHKDEEKLLIIPASNNYYGFIT